MSRSKEYSEFINKHKGETIIVCGCGSSLNEFAPYNNKFITIGVNDVARLFDPNYLIVINGKNTFKRWDRWSFIETFKGPIFSQYNADELELPNSNLIKIQFKRTHPLDDYETVGHSNNSPYVGCHIAANMGAKTIGLVGVDFTPNHFFTNSGNHSLIKTLNTINIDYKFLFDECKRLGIEFYNLSKNSAVTAIPKMSIDEFVTKYS